MPVGALDLSQAALVEVLVSCPLVLWTRPEEAATLVKLNQREPLGPPVPLDESHFQSVSPPGPHRYWQDGLPTCAALAVGQLAVVAQDLASVVGAESSEPGHQAARQEGPVSVPKAPQEVPVAARLQCEASQLKAAA